MTVCEPGSELSADPELRRCPELGLPASGTVGNRHLLPISRPEWRNHRAGGGVTAARTDQTGSIAPLQKGVMDPLSPEGLVGIRRQEQTRRFQNVQTDRHRGQPGSCQGAAGRETDWESGTSRCKLSRLG